MKSKLYRPLESDPLWYKDAVIYETHVRSFFDSDNDGIGDFFGLTTKLDYLAELGISAIWLLPFYPSPRRDDGYDISDYRNIAPDYGTLKDFRNFIRQAHRRGIRVITELVINHTSDQHPWFQAARHAPPGSAKRDYYIWSDTDKKFSETRIIFCDTESSNWAWDPIAKAYYWHRFYSHQPDLNLNNPKVVRAVMKVLRYWLELGVDGVRLDAVPYLCVKKGTNNENLPETHEVIKQIRSFVDRNFENRMLLAEANQWPEDVRPYFGDGDECHMAFHFPLMPRIYIALRKEDRDPITEIMERTPDIPDNCQWGLFLRNHDELTLEMVTSDERDYMWEEYAHDPRMRLNLGIRRRLAPLVQNSIRRLEMLNSLLFSFPGSPIVYYGDEIGMGDNIYLGDRHGVRTPMQWSYDRNGGFSRADPAKLYLPAIMDPVYGYQAVNVEAQDRNISSFLNFMRRMIGLRRQYKAFGRGSFRFLHPRNRKVLVYLREYEDELILCVCNLSRFPQPVELDLSMYAGRVPMEIFGRTEFPPIGELPYFLTLGPHAFMWFKLEPEAQPLSVDLSKTGEIKQPPTLMLSHPEDDFLQGLQIRSALEDVLGEYIRRQRWFKGKTKLIEAVKLYDYSKVGAFFFFVFVEFTYEDGSAERYFLPLRIAYGDAARELTQTVPEYIVALLKTGTEGGVLLDALYERRSCQLLVSIMHNEREFREPRRLHIFGTRSSVLDEVLKEGPLTEQVTPVEGEQSNTSINFSGRAILKAFRNVQIGVNPELELSRFLAEESTFRNFPRLAGTIECTFAERNRASLLVLQEFVPNEGDGWEYTSRQLQNCLARNFPIADADALLADYQPLSAPDQRIPHDLTQLLGEYSDAAELLGKRTAELHAALSSGQGTRAFQAEPLSINYIQTVTAQIHERIHLAVSTISNQTEFEARAPLSRLLAASGAVTERIHTLENHLRLIVEQRRLPLIRCHGDYHLAQVLRVPGDFYIFDFEGEPLLPLEQRRRKHSPTKDIAGMLRSFSYAAYTARDGKDDEALVITTKLWEKGATAHFLKGYRESVRGNSVLNMEASDFSELLELFILEKEFYELFYELSYRPAWIHIPLEGILKHVPHKS